VLMAYMTRSMSFFNATWVLKIFAWSQWGGRGLGGPPLDPPLVYSCLAQLSEQFQSGSAIVSKFSIVLSEYINMVSMFKHGDRI
jgi:hypothetical protein